MGGLRLLTAAALLLACGLSWAASQVLVVGLFPGAAVLNVDGQRKLVKVGQTGPGGVVVVSADSRGAVLRVDGVERAYSLSREYNAGFAEPSKRQLSIAKGIGGHYWVAGSVDGHSVQFLVDTGATSVALNDGHARRLGIDYRVVGRPLQVSTASGTVRGWRINLNSVKIGSLEVLGVEAVVLEGGSPTEALLGMSFLSRVGWRVEQDLLVLESKY
ncbi:TIGR02281 family clan AA aspartic protease [Pseudomonas sp. sp1636]|uniref:retropepsin-like aspartic protease family protein n=1 Tax=Pseudomonas sp. sp1636 TaxID=3036707 RepID=UPI0025A60BD1|nr:TIGR02281 family clan AA aspartic protease [Pseudomonas sp. sp1636]MDM8348020.1 TIGR02281 family clan AA aspartic protease [Pseudomonas sp. sp1636]